MDWYFSTQSTLLPQSLLAHSYKCFIFYAEALLTEHVHNQIHMDWSGGNLRVSIPQEYFRVESPTSQ